MTLARRGWVREAGWTRLAHGLHVPSGGLDDRARLRAWQLALPPVAGFTGLSAAAARGWWLPPLPEPVPLFAALPLGTPRPRRPGLIVHRSEAVELTVVGGVRVATAGESLLAAARWLGVLDTVVLLDAALHAGDVTAEDLSTVAAAPRPGVTTLRRALRWADGRAESPWESLLRVLLVSADVPVVPQAPLPGSRRGDLRIVGTCRLMEYDGAVHRERRQHRADLTRDRDLVRAGFERCGYSADTVLYGGVSILRDADDALGRPHDPRRIRTWWALLRDSAFHAPGRARLSASWHHRLVTNNTWKRPGPVVSDQSVGQRRGTHSWPDRAARTTATPNRASVSRNPSRS